MKHRYLILALLVILSSVPGFCQMLGFSLVEGKEKVKIPIEIYNNLVVVPVVLNETLPLKFILDTGVRTAILTEKSFTDILNLSYSRKYTISGPGGEKLIDAYVTNNVSLDLPGVVGPGHAMLVLEEDYLELRNYLGTEVHGILGYELFSRFIIRIDYHKKMLTLMQPQKFRVPRKFQMVPIQIEDTKPFVLIPVELVNGTKIDARLLVDSGASHGLMLDPQSDSRITVPDTTVSSTIGRGLGGEIKGKIGRVNAIQLGPYSLNKVIASFPDPNSYFDSLSMLNLTRNGSLGGEVLSRFSVIFNFPKEEIYLKKNPNFKKDFHYNMSGMIVKAKGVKLNVFEVTDVREGSTSDKADIRKGDLIMSINGYPTALMNLSLINGFFNSRPGKRVKLKIFRDGQNLTREFRLRDQI